MEGGFHMSDDNFNAILQALKSGQNPTPPSSGNSGLSTSQRGNTSGTKEVHFGLRSVNERAGADSSDNPSDNS